MKARTKGWTLVIEIIATVIFMEAFFIWLLLETSMGDGIPDALKIWGPIAIGLVTLVFLYAHRTPEGSIEYKVK
jgi:hypothetical protein